MGKVRSAILACLVPKKKKTEEDTSKVTHLNAKQQKGSKQTALQIRKVMG